MKQQRNVPYGAWKSPISAADAARADGRPDWPGWVGRQIWWTEPRPAEEGRITLMRHRGEPGTSPEEVLGPPWNVRSRVIEYGGRPWAAADGRAESGGPLVVFCNFADQRLYRFEPGNAGTRPEPISPVPEYPAGMRFADFFIHPLRAEVWGVRETITGPAPTDVRRDIAAVPLDGSAARDPARIRVLAANQHFLACPRLAPGWSDLSWIGWDHPAMPWDETKLWVAGTGYDGTLDPEDGGDVSDPRLVAGRPGESIVQAEWLSEFFMAYVSDAGGWWNLYEIDVLSGDHSADPRTATQAPVRSAVSVCPMEEEFGGALWRLGQQWFVPLPDDIAAIHGRSTTRLSVLHPWSEQPPRSAAAPRTVDSPYTEWAPCLAVREYDPSADCLSEIAAVAASPERPYELVRVDLDHGKVTVVRPAQPHRCGHEYIPRPAERVLRGGDGRDIHAVVYAPRNPEFRAPEGELPPYLIFVHGGPTGRVPVVHDLEIAYFTSRGIGVAEVAYGGSTGHGRAYRERLRENWGVVDVEDCAAVAAALAAEGTADPARLVIRGGSAGGWTAACSLTGTAGIYRGGIIYYPILDLVGWRTGETHDFESQYLESLAGPWPQASQRYHERSPVNRADRLTAPFLLLQGLDDEICPPVQCDRFLERVAGRGIPHAYLAFPGEQHGFRREETITTALEAELSFLGQVLGFEPPGVPALRLTV